MYRIFYLYPPITIWIGYHLASTIQSGNLWRIVVQSFACLFITAATILAYRGFYYKGKANAYREEMDYLEKLKRDSRRN